MTTLTTDQAEDLRHPGRAIALDHPRDVSGAPTHPLYREYADLWRFYRLSYAGGPDYCESFLFSHEKERLKDFKRRMQRAYYPNHTRLVVDTYASHLYRNTISRQPGSETIERLHDNMDLRGTAADQFYEKFARKVKAAGVAHILVDKTRAEDGTQPLTRAQEREAGIAPYAQIIDPEDLIDWRMDRHGRFVWAMIREPEPTSRGPFDAPDAPRWRYRVWHKETWELYSLTEGESPEGKKTTSAQIVEWGRHPCGRVPIVSGFWGERRGCEPIATSAIQDLAPANRRLFNFVSLIDEQIYQHVFNVLCVPQTMWEQIKSQQGSFSVAGMIPVPDEGTRPFYLGPDVSQIGTIRSEIEKTENEVRRLSGLGYTGETSAAAHSGEALSYLQHDKNALLLKFGARMADVEAQVDELASLWMEMPHPEENDRSYPESYDIDGLSKELKQGQDLLSLGLGGKARAEVHKQAFTRSAFGRRLDADNLDKILSDIDARAELEAQLIEQSRNGA